MSRRRFEVGDIVLWGDTRGTVVDANSKYGFVRFDGQALSTPHYEFLQCDGKDWQRIGPACVVIEPVKLKRKIKVYRWEKIITLAGTGNGFLDQTFILTETPPREGWTKVPGSEREIEVEE